MKPTEDQITAAARALSNDNADICNVNREDNWMLYGDSFRETAKIALEAALAVSPVMPAGFRLVPIEPTEDMVVSGFESWPDRYFSKPEDWAAFEAMTGCQQAAHKARLCYAAMIEAAPTAPAQPCGCGVNCLDKGAAEGCRYTAQSAQPCGEDAANGELLSQEQREALCEAIAWAHDDGLPGTADMLRSILNMRKLCDGGAIGLTDEQLLELRLIARTYNEQGFRKHAREFFARASLPAKKVAQAEPVNFVFPPMPHAVVMHEKVGPLFDRLSMQFYASKCISLAAPPAQTQVALDDNSRGIMSDALGMYARKHGMAPSQRQAIELMLDRLAAQPDCERQAEELFAMQRALTEIANADTVAWDDPTQYEAWAKWRARAVLGKITKEPT